MGLLLVRHCSVSLLPLLLGQNLSLIWCCRSPKALALLKGIWCRWHTSAASCCPPESWWPLLQAPESTINKFLGQAGFVWALQLPRKPDGEPALSSMQQVQHLPWLWLPLLVHSSTGSLMRCSTSLPRAQYCCPPYQKPLSCRCPSWLRICYIHDEGACGAGHPPAEWQGAT